MTLLTRRGLRIALVTAFPPSTGPLSEYAWHLVNALRTNPDVDELHVFCDEVPGPSPCQDPKVRIHPCWRFSSAAMPLDTSRAVRACRPDVIWLQLHLTSTGNTRGSRFAGLASPALFRALGYPTLVTLHNMLGPTDLTRTAIRVRQVDLLGAALATRLTCCAHLVCVSRPEYVELLHRAGYGSKVRVVPLGAPGVPLPGPSSHPRSGVLAFGHFGSNKRLEPVIAAIRDIAAICPSMQLRVAGTSSRHAPGYLEGLRTSCAGDRHVSFLGYVPEEDVPGLFMRASVSVLPYTTMTGTSSVALQSAMYGASIVASDIPMFRALDREGLRMRFFDWSQPSTLTTQIRAALHEDPQQRWEDQEANLAYCRTQSMDRVADQYVDLLKELRARPGRPT